MLGRDDIGELSPGKRADLAVWRTDGLELGGAADPVAGLVLSAPHRVDRLYVARRGWSATGTSSTPTRTRSPASIGSTRKDCPRDLHARPRHGAGTPACGVRVQLFRGEELVAERETDDDGRVRDLADVDAGRYRLVFHPESPFFKRVEAEIEIEAGRDYHVPLLLSPVRVRDLPRQLDAEQLGELFEGDTALMRKLAEMEDPLGHAPEIAAVLTEDEKLEALNAHPAIGARAGLSARSAAEQGEDADPEVLAELARLNAEYEERFGFRFVVFVNRRPKAEILEVLRERIRRTRGEELDTAVGELVAIAEDRWRRS